jgi:hypothetical protein
VRLGGEHGKPRTGNLCVSGRVATLALIPRERA